MTERRRMFVLNNPTAPRLSPELAGEIGLPESILLLQIEFWISISDHYIEGNWWTYQSIRDIKRLFIFWSLETINRTIKSLVRQELIKVANHNKEKYDKTRWFAICESGLVKLQSITTLGNPSQNETPLSKDETTLSHNETTIPETTPENTSEITTSSIKQFTEELRSRYPDLDFDTELEKFHLYWSEGKRVLKRPKLALRNWMAKAREFNKGDKGGENRRPSANRAVQASDLSSEAANAERNRIDREVAAEITG